MGRGLVRVRGAALSGFQPAGGAHASGFTAHRTRVFFTPFTLEIRAP
jgi:hypothetical protein